MPTRPGEPIDPDRPGAAPPRPRSEPQPGSRSESQPESESESESGDALGRLAVTVARLRRQVEEAHAAAGGRALVELAKGVLVERLHCGPYAAGRQLELLAETSGVSQLELAADIVNQAAQDELSAITGQLLAASDSRQPAPDLTHLRTAESGILAARDTQAVADSLLRYALAPLDATAVAVWAAGSDGSLRLAGSAGFAEAEAARWHYVPPGVATLARRALDERRTRWTRTLAESRLPSIGGRTTQQAGRVVVPAGTGGRLLGALEISWPGPLPPQTPQIQRQIEALAELCGHTLDSHQPRERAPGPSPLVELVDGLWDPAMVLQPELDADGAVRDFRIHHLNSHVADLAGRSHAALTGCSLLEAYPMSAQVGGVFEKLEHVHATGEPFRARRMAVTTLVDQVPLTVFGRVSITRHGHELALTWRVDDEATRLADLLQHAQRLGRIGGFEENLRTGEIIWNSQLFDLCGLLPTDAPVPVSQLAQHAHPDDATALGRFLRTLLHHRRPASTAFRMQRADGTARYIRVVAEPILGAREELLAVRGAFQDVSSQHWTEVALAATRDQLAHSEKQAVEQNRLTLQLQHAIMPPTTGPIDTLGLHIAVRYRPAEKDHMVGGDWYDIVTLPSGQVMLSVGDIAGHGIEAATSMVVLRNALRGLAATGAGPGALLGWLNTVAHFLTDNVTATAVCALYDPATRILRWARAGHLPPVLVRQGRAQALPMVKGILLGAVGEAQYEEGDVQLEPDDTLLIYTDGLIEQRDRSVQSSLDQLLATAQRSTTTLDDRLDYLLTHSSADTDDDTCVIGIQLAPTPEGDSFDWQVSPAQDG
ncbi:SpoIIE family protein phosphatase [Streptacidiphilus sp. P02-A3a]|uniref:SpoIIE family protein phosphatase n=1 Tax=Streptacidiphilus sp. P02-A3a TaxID=2704468 RepID=UPI0015F7A29B|nr:SpoIIE family protein phosphatase [Streptacidiphilus sp. P02-A3a]QMU70557.1 SpoIIE family protein phosphatase [Streptacidiphilus sp. P02-A3a]